MVQALQGPSLEERVAKLQKLLDEASSEVRQEYQDRFDIAWIYHDSALEGVVYSMDELRSAMRDEVVTDTSLIPVYDEIRNHMGAIEMIREQVDEFVAEATDAIEEQGGSGRSPFRGQAGVDLG